MQKFVVHIFRRIREYVLVSKVTTQQDIYALKDFAEKIKMATRSRRNDLLYASC